MADKLFRFFFCKKQKNNCIRVSRNECSENKIVLLKQKIKIDFEERGKFYSVLFSQDNCL